MADRPYDDEADDLPRADPSEGVRLIKADEAAEAVERGDAVKRRGTRRAALRRPPRAPGGPRPSLRFPLDDTADPSLAGSSPRRPGRPAAGPDRRRTGPRASPGPVSPSPRDGIGLRIRRRAPDARRADLPADQRQRRAAPLDRTGDR